ncbi:MAG: hypothetical protein VCE43_08815 [Myxococcota bacterium]
MAGTRWLGFEAVESPSHSGDRSAHLRLSWKPGERERPVHVKGAVQELSPSRFPTRIGGWFWVQSWENASEQTDMYLQAVVIVKGDPRARELISPGDPDATQLDNYQIRYYLGGVTEPPFELTNARLKNVRPGPPPIGEWAYFEMPVRDDFESLWGIVPANYEYLRIFFEARWDHKEPGAALSADIYYDDLFFGFEPWP